MVNTEIRIHNVNFSPITPLTQTSYIFYLLVSQ